MSKTKKYTNIKLIDLYQYTLTGKIYVKTSADMRIKRYLGSFHSKKRGESYYTTHQEIIRYELDNPPNLPKYFLAEIDRQASQLEPVPYPTYDQLRLLERVCQAIDEAGNTGYSEKKIAQMLNDPPGLSVIFAEIFREAREGIMFYNSNVPDYINACNGWYVKRNPSWRLVLDEKLSMLDDDGELDREIVELEKQIAEIEAQ